MQFLEAADGNAHQKAFRRTNWRNPEFHARRWVIEVTRSFFNRFRKLLVRFEKKAANYLPSFITRSNGSFPSGRSARRCRAAGRSNSFTPKSTPILWTIPATVRRKSCWSSSARQHRPLPFLGRTFRSGRCITLARRPNLTERGSQFLPVRRAFTRLLETAGGWIQFLNSISTSLLSCPPTSSSRTPKGARLLLNEDM